MRWLCCKATGGQHARRQPRLEAGQAGILGTPNVARTDLQAAAGGPGGGNRTRTPPRPWAGPTPAQAAGSGAVRQHRFILFEG